MNPEFWHERWAANQIGFHRADVHPFLARYWPTLKVVPGATVFVPLCGKSLDMHWLAERGHEIIGVELSEAAVSQFFAEAGLQPKCDSLSGLKRYTASGITLYCGDFFSLTEEMMIDTGGIYDRAALVALPPDIRRRYVHHLRSILPRRHLDMLLVTLEYDQSLVAGPPHCVPATEIDMLFNGDTREHLASMPDNAPPPKFVTAGISELTEHAWRIRLAPSHG
ncbi:MAG: thiopurine S-methyltransferase [Gammaproteobacteria bacterium]|nr:thiopurine S-methyltransferase [Gammaproteobacteria bacterium]